MKMSNRALQSSLLLAIFACLGLDLSPALAAQDGWYVALGPCELDSAGLLVSRVNAPNAAPECLTTVIPSAAADAATQLAVADLGRDPGRDLLRIEADSRAPSKVRQIFTVVGTPANPLETPVDRLQFYQGSATGCKASALFSFSSLNNAGLFAKGTLRAWGETDVRVNAVYDLPEGWTLERLRYEVLYEQAAFRGIVERPTFDILHPRAERPLLVTVFDLLPTVRSTNRCSAL